MSKANVNQIKTSDDYKKALERLEDIFDAKIGTKDGDELEVLTSLIECYELKQEKNK